MAYVWRMLPEPPWTKLFCEPRFSALRMGGVGADLLGQVGESCGLPVLRAVAAQGSPELHLDTGQSYRTSDETFDPRLGAPGIWVAGISPGVTLVDTFPGVAAAAGRMRGAKAHSETPGMVKSPERPLRPVWSFVKRYPKPSRSRVSLITRSAK
jgi:hypothetical protein